MAPIRLLITTLLLTSLAWAQTPEPFPDPGPPSTRDLFPLNLVPLTYRPVGANTIGEGQWRMSFQITRANTFEFSDVIKDHLSRDSGGRVSVSRANAEEVAKALPNQPLIFFFDGEIQRTELSFRHGVTPSTDVALTLAWQSVGGGFLDGVIESFHKLGFEQTGREAIAKNQLTLAVIQNGKVVSFTQEPVRAHFEDPLVAVIQRLHQGPRLTLSLVGALQVPMTEWGGVKADWNNSLALVSQWRPTERQAVNAAVAYLRRHMKGNSEVDSFYIKDQVAGHLGWEWCGWRNLRPFLMLVYHDRLASPRPDAKVDQPSLIHDLGMHIRLSARTALTFSYINNITHNENTADMGFALRLAFRP